MKKRLTTMFGLIAIATIMLLLVPVALFSPGRVNEFLRACMQDALS